MLRCVHKCFSTYEVGVLNTVSRTVSIALLFISGTVLAQSSDTITTESATVQSVDRDDAAKGGYSNPVDSPNVPSRDRFKDYLKDIYSPAFLMESTVATIRNHVRQDPEQWSGGSIGLKKRLGHAFTRRFVERSIEHSVAAALGEIRGYQRSNEKRFWPRARHAILSTFLTPRVNGGRSIAYSRLAGTVGSFFIANTWYPTGTNGKSDALRRSGTSLGADVGVNVLMEFWPDIRRKISKKKTSKSRQ